MPIKKAAFKHLLQTKKQTARNIKVKNQIRFLVKKTRKAFAAKDKNKAAEALKKAIKVLDKAAQKKIIKKNKASRLKSRLSKQLNQLK